MTTQAEQVDLWTLFASRVQLNFPFQIDLIVRPHKSGSETDTRAELGVNLHVLDRETHEPITVHTRRPCAAWSTDEAAIEMLFDLLGVALRHEIHEAVKIDGKLVCDLHAGNKPLLMVG
jgi:hypothetical protein